MSWREELELGRLESAFAVLEVAAGDEAAPVEVLLSAGELALWKNRLASARRWLESASKIAPDDAEVSALLAEVAYRELDFAEASTLLGRAGRTAQAAQLASFAAAEPYRILGPATAEVEFVQTDPLPVVELSVNGAEPAFFVIDTGGGELILDPEFADKVGAARFGKRTGTFAGDAKAEIELGRVDRVTLGAFTVETVPVRLLPTGRFSAVTWGRPVAGVLGTTLLRQFRFVLDYPGGRLSLRRFDSETPPPPEEIVAEVPFWLVADHLIVAEGCVGVAEPLMLLVDTGLAGAALAAPSSTLTEAGIELGEGSFEGVGGGGKVTVTPFRAARVCLGDLEALDVFGLAGAFPESLEHKLGFRLAGLVSHALLRPYVVAFDFETMTITISKPERDE